MNPLSMITLSSQDVPETVPTPLFTLQQLCLSSRTKHLLKAIKQFSVSGDRGFIEPVQGKISYLLERIALIVRVLLPIWQLETITIDRFSFSVPAILRSHRFCMMGSRDAQKRIQELEERHHALFEFAKLKGTVYRISSEGRYLEYHSPSSKTVPEGILNRSLYDVLTPANYDTAKLLVETIQECLAKNISRDVYYQIWERRYHAIVLPMRLVSSAYLVVNRIT